MRKILNAIMKGKPFDFHGAKFTIKVLSSETDYKFTVLDIFHPPTVDQHYIHIQKVQKPFT